MKKRMKNDRLSELPEETLLHILSFIDLKKAATTSVLSKKWQFLWCKLPVLRFRESTGPKRAKKTRDFVSWIHRTLRRRPESYDLEKFKVDFMYAKRYSSDLSAWVRFALDKKVKILSLDLHPPAKTCFYKLPQVLYFNSTLTSLCLRRCRVAPPAEMEWPCLNRLTVRDMELTEDVIRNIISACPVLSTLRFLGCWGFQLLDLDDSPSLQKLELELESLDEEDKSHEYQYLLEISAPFLRSLKVMISPVDIELQLINVQSLVTADIWYTDFGDSEEERDTAIQVFEKIKHVEDFIVESHFIYVLTRNLRVPQTSLKSLKVDNAWRDEAVVEGILILLESSPNLETLIIECHNSYEPKAEEGDPIVSAWVPAARNNDLNCDLLNLKFVHLLDFADPNLAGEPMLTVARMLLKRATSLEKMEINAKGNLTEFPSEFANMSQTVLSYPRFSEKAVVVFHQ